MRKIIITGYGNGILTAVEEDGRVAELHAEPVTDAPRVGDIFLARVENVVKNLNSAFVELGGGRKAYLPLDREKPLAVCGERRACQGETVLVQVEKEAVKTKTPVVSGTISLAGESLVLLCPGSGVRLSRKIGGDEQRARLKALLEGELPEGTGAVVRTEAVHAPEEEILAELRRLREELERILSSYRYRTAFTCLHRGKTLYETVLERRLADPETEEAVTDLSEVWEKISSLPKTRFYDDASLSLTAAHDLEKALKKATDRHVWLPCGGYLVIEPTEALTVIDVNTGKNDLNKKKEAAVRRTNREAAAEIAAQLRLRNLSGMILVDFIDQGPEETKALLEEMRALLRKDPVLAEAVDVTGLGLMELTRKRVRRPLYEQLASVL